MKIKVKITRQENATYFNSEINSIVEVEFEEYIAAVTASEIGNGQLEACKAQAIACRTFAVNRGVLSGTPISDASSTAQAYRAKRYNKNSYPNCIEAANTTIGQILIYNGKPISAVYSSSNGGRTTSAKERWGTNYPYLIEQNDPWDTAAGGNGGGHGVGMSQKGANYAAKIGKSYKEILAFYYPGTLIQYGYGKHGEVLMSEVTEKVVEKATSLMGSPYVWGATGEKCTVANRKKRLNSPKLTEISKNNIKKRCPVLSGKQTTCAGCKYEGKNEYDCIGFVNAVNNACGIKLKGAGATYHWGNTANFIRRGPIAEMPNVVCCVYQADGSRMSHIGFHIGGGNIIHCSGKGEVMIGSVADKAWTHYAIPVGYYTEEYLKQAKIVDTSFTLLKKGSRGDNVFKLQQMLNALGFNCGEPDGAFGSNTEAAVKNFQEKYGLSVDGKVGQATWPKIKEVYEEKVKPEESDIEPEPQPIHDDDQDKDEIIDDEDFYEILQTIQKQIAEIQARIEALENK